MSEDDAIMPEEVVVKKTRRKKTEEEINALKEARERTSMFGGKFPESLPADWVFADPVGWYYYPIERDAFSRTYCCCENTDKYIKTSEAVRTEHGGYISVAVAKESYTLCPISKTYFGNGTGREVYTDADKKILVSETAWSSSFRKCDFTGKYYPRTHVIKINQSQSYNYVCLKAFQEHFGMCQSCGGNYEKSRIKAWPEIHNKVYCYTCGDKILYQQVILAHDAKDYPSPVCTKSERYGHTVKDGLVVATMKKAPVTNIRRFGTEVETEFSMKLAKAADVTRKKIAYDIKKVLGDDFVIIKEDGTLTMNGKYSDQGNPGELYAGFEIVTAPADLAAHRERWLRLPKSPYYTMLRAWDTETCGHHVHVSRAALSELQIGRMLEFINHPNNKKFVQLVAGRSEKKFTRYVPKNVVDVLHPERVVNPDEEKSRDRARRVALNVSNPNTVEFRIFRGTINPKHILRNIEFCDAVCDFCMPCTRSLSELQHPKFFVEFINKNRKKWQLLAEWMVLHKLIVLRPIGDKANKELVTLKPHAVEEGEDKTDEGLIASGAKKIDLVTLQIPTIQASSIQTAKLRTFDYSALVGSYWSGPDIEWDKPVKKKPSTE